MKSNKVIVTVPVTGLAGDRSTPFLPITPRDIAESALDAGKFHYWIGSINLMSASKLLLLTIHPEYVKYDYHILHGD